MSKKRSKNKSKSLRMKRRQLAHGPHPDEVLISDEPSNKVYTHRPPFNYKSTKDVNFSDYADIKSHLS